MGRVRQRQDPNDALAAVPARLGPYLRADAAAAYFAFSAAFAVRFGSALTITEAYRDYARQEYLYDGWINHRPGFNLAAPPGTSVHGWALACDFGSGVDSYGTPQKQWADSEGPMFGWIPTGNGFSSREAWHFEFNGEYSPDPGDGDDEDVFKPRFVRVDDQGSPLHGLVAFLFPDRVVRTASESEILSLGRAWGVLEPGESWGDMVDDLTYGEFVAAETEINSSRVKTRGEYVDAIVAALGKR